MANFEVSIKDQVEINMEYDFRRIESIGRGFGIRKSRIKFLKKPINLNSML